MFNNNEGMVQILGGKWMDIERMNITNTFGNPLVGKNRTCIQFKNNGTNINTNHLLRQVCKYM